MTYDYFPDLYPDNPGHGQSLGKGLFMTYYFIVCRPGALTLYYTAYTCNRSSKFKSLYRNVVTLARNVLPA